MVFWILIASTAFAVETAVQKAEVPAQSDAQETDPAFDWSCRIGTFQGQIRNVKGGQVIPIDAASTVHLEHKLDIDFAEDRCITEVRIEHQPDRGCAYEMVFGVVAGEPGLRLIDIAIGADSFCPGWRDWVETSDPNNDRRLRNVRSVPGNPLKMSTRIVPDRTADTSCTDIDLSVGGEVLLSRLGRSPATYALEGIAVRGQFNSRGNTAAVCPAKEQPSPVFVNNTDQTVESGPEVRVPFALLVNIGTPSIPTIPGFAGGLTALVEVSPRTTFGVSWQGFGTEAGSGGVRYAQWQQSFGDPATTKPKAFAGLRLGRQSFDRITSRFLEPIEEFDAWLIGPALGVELSRSRASPFYASVDLAGYLYNEKQRVISTSFGDLEATGFGATATVRIGAFLGNRQQVQ